MVAKLEKKRVPLGGHLPLGLVETADGPFEQDLKIVDRYQAFSAELLRLSLLGIAGVGFLVTNIFLKEESGRSYQAFQSQPEIKYLLIYSLGLLGAASAFALAHRYVAIDSIWRHLQYIRHVRRKENGDDVRAAEANKSRDRHFYFAYWSLWASAAFLGIGAITLAVAFIYWARAL